MAARALMFQGTGSDVGKSLVVAGLCRLLAKRGLRVVPFKAQNMSNNAAVVEGGEIGRAQWLQAVAAGVAPHVGMNPVLLKPQSDRVSQVVVRGKVAATMGAAEYQRYRPSLLPIILESYRALAKDADIVLVEGAGSPAEINLRAGDVANMGFARAANCPVVLIGDIERGGVIASMVGTHAVLEATDRAMIRAFLINKFRGDAALFKSGADEIAKRTGWEDLGLIHHHANLGQLPQEDSLNRPRAGTGSGQHIVVLTTPHMANFDDLDPLAGEPGVRLTWLSAGEAIPADAKLVILGGSKSTMADLAFIRAQGWDKQLDAHYRRGGRILGICGGYQMLGKMLSDPEAVESDIAEMPGLGLLDVATIFGRDKKVCPWQGNYHGMAVEGYEIHAGNSIGADNARPFFDGEGACSADGNIIGTYVHGLFANDAFRQQFLGLTDSPYRYRAHTEQLLDGWAEALSESISIEKLLALAAPVQ